MFPTTFKAVVEAVPATSNLNSGFVVPIPTLPVVAILMLSVLPLLPENIKPFAMNIKGAELVVSVLTATVLAESRPAQ